MVEFSKEEEELLKTQKLARIVTLSKDGYPHVAPMWFTHDGRHIIFATNSDTTKIANINRNSKVAVLVDSQDPYRVEGTLIRGKAEILKKGDRDFQHALDLMIEKYPEEKGYEGPKQRIIKVTPTKSSYWKF